MENRGTGVEVKSNLDKRQEIIRDIIKGANNGFGRLRETPRQLLLYNIIMNIMYITYICVCLRENTHTHTHSYTHLYTYIHIYTARMCKTCIMKL